MEESPSSKSSKSSKSLSGLRGLTSPEIEEILLKLEKLDRRRSNLDEEHPGYGRKMKAIAKKEVALRKQLQVERKRQKLREGFKGAPSSYRHFCFSSAVNRRLRNHQDIEEYNPARQNPFFRKQMQRQRENTVAGRAKRQARLEKQRLKMHEEMEARWKGVPSTTRKLSFSSTANRHIKNEQEYEPVTTYEPDLSSVASPKAHERWGLVPDREDEAEPPVYPGLVHHETPWMGSPSSYQKLSFSSSANRHITRKQAIPGSRVAKTAPRKDEEPEWRRRERREQRWREKGRGPPKRIQRERGWQGSPSTFDFTLTFSSSANKKLRSKQALPELKPLNDKPKVKKLTKKQIARRKRIAKAKKELEDKFVGSPTSYRRLSYSKAANRLITNHQDFSDYTDPLELEFFREPSDDGGRQEGGDNEGSDGEPDAEQYGRQPSSSNRASTAGTNPRSGRTSPASSRPTSSGPFEKKELEFYFKGAVLTPRGTKEVSFELPQAKSVKPYVVDGGFGDEAAATDLDVEGLQLSDEFKCFVLDWTTVREGMKVPYNVFVGGHGGFSQLYFARAEVSDAANSDTGSIVVVGQVGGVDGELQKAHLPLGSMPFEADTYHVLVVRNQPEKAVSTETDLQWVPCRAGEPVPPGAISGDEQGSVYLARAALAGKPHMKGGGNGPQISFPGCVRAYLGEDGTTPCLHKANIPTNNSILDRQHFDVLCLQQYSREPDHFDGYDL